MSVKSAARTTPRLRWRRFDLASTFSTITLAVLVAIVIAGLALPAAPDAATPGATPTSPASAGAELIMFDDPACVWCKRWHREIGVVYDRTDEGRTAPLRVVQLRQGLPGDTEFSAPVVVTPTFVLTKNGREIGRILGYPGEDLFWGLLSQELDKLQPEPAADPPLTRTRLAPKDHDFTVTLQ